MIRLTGIALAMMLLISACAKGPPPITPLVTAPERVIPKPTDFPKSWQVTLAEALEWGDTNAPAPYSAALWELATDWQTMRDKLRTARTKLRKTSATH